MWSDRGWHSKTIALRCRWKADSALNVGKDFFDYVVIFMSTILFPRKGDRLRANSVFFQAMRVAASGKGVLTGMVPSRSSATAVAVASGTYRNVNVIGTYAGGSLTAIPAASSGMLRFDLIVFDVSDTTLKRVAGSEDIPPVISDFLETTTPQPPELASASQILLGVVRVSSSGIGAVAYGHYATDSIANMIIELPSPLPLSTAVQFGATSRVLARKTAGAGAGEECTLSEILDFIGSAARGDIFYRGASGWLKLVKGVAGYVLTQGADDPAWASDPIVAALTTRGQMIYRGATGPLALNKGVAGQGLVQGADDPVWTTRSFKVAYAFGDGFEVLEADQEYGVSLPVACKVVAVTIREITQTTGTVTCSLYRHALADARGNAIDTFTITNAKYFSEGSLSWAFTKDQWATIVISGITSAKKIVCMVEFEAT